MDFFEKATKEYEAELDRVDAAMWSEYEKNHKKVSDAAKSESDSVEESIDVSESVHDKYESIRSGFRAAIGLSDNEKITEAHIKRNRNLVRRIACEKYMEEDYLRDKLINN